MTVKIEKKGDSFPTLGKCLDEGGSISGKEKEVLALINGRVQTQIGK